jgi:hypothetical protein
MGLWKFLKGLFGSKETEDCGCDTPGSCPTPEVCEVEVPTVEVVETKKEVVVEVPTVEVPVQAEETKVTAKEIKAKRRRPAKKTEEVKEVVATEEPVVKAKPRRRRKPKAKPENGDQA